MSMNIFNNTTSIALALASTLMLTACDKSNETTVNDTPSTPPANVPMPPATNTTVSSSDNIATATANTPSTGNGEKVYQASCRVCHDTGNLGSPRMGDTTAWQPRIAQGKDTLYAHAIHGFTGKTGTMPPKGTSTAPDADIKSAVDYMVAHSQ